MCRHLVVLRQQSERWFIPLSIRQLTSSLAVLDGVTDLIRTLHRTHPEWQTQ